MPFFVSVDYTIIIECIKWNKFVLVFCHAILDIICKQKIALKTN